MSNTFLRLSPLSLALAAVTLQAQQSAPGPSAAAAESAESITVSVGAPTPDSLAKLVLSRFATATPAAFDSIYPDPLGRDFVESSVQAKSTRYADLGKVLWSGPDRAVMLIAGIARPKRAGNEPAVGVEAGGNDVNRARRFSGLYEAVKSNGTWMLTHQIPFDTANYIHSQNIHTIIKPGTGLQVIDTLALTIGNPQGFGVRLNAATQLADVQLDGKKVQPIFKGGILWIQTPPREHAQLVMRYSLKEDPPRSSRDGKKPSTDSIPSFGAYHNTDAWLPFFGYDSGNSFAQLAVTAEIPATYRLTTSIPQTESVANGVRTVVGHSMHPEFLISLIYDKHWNVETSTIQTPVGPIRIQTFLTPEFRFTHDSLAKVVDKVYQVIGSRFGEPQAPSRYMALVADRALGAGGFRVRMNNAVVSGIDGGHLDDPLGPGYVLAHETSHGWTMNASGFAANMLQEGWATYAEATVVGAVSGPEAERAFWEKERTGYMTGRDRAGFLGGFEGHQSILGNPDNGRIHYFKGSWVLRSLNHVLGDSVFDAGMRAYIARRRTGGVAGYQEFIADLSHAAGRDLTGFVMPWLSGKYIPDVNARIDGQTVIVTQDQPDVVFDLPLDVALTTSSGTVRRSVHLTGRADTLNVADLGTVTDVRVDPDHHFLLQRHYGEMVRFEYPVSAAPNAKKVELSGNFLREPMAATRTGDVWSVELPMSEGRYIWQWRIDGKNPSDDEAIASVNSPSSPSARSGVRWVKPLQRLDHPYPY